MKYALVGTLLAVTFLTGASAEQGSMPADFSLPALQGEAVSLSDYRGDWVVVNYWAIWCKPCVKEIPDLAALHARRDDVTVLGIAFDESDPADISAFLEDFSVNYPILLVDTFDPAEGVETPMVLPTTVLFDGGGVQRKRFLGAVTAEQIESAMKDIEAAGAEEA